MPPVSIEIRTARLADAEALVASRILAMRESLERIGRDNYYVRPASANRGGPE